MLISIFRNAGLGVPDTVSRHENAAPPCASVPLRSPTAGAGCSSCAAASRFCATQSASVRAFSAVALSALCATLRKPAASATARIASATRTSTSVNPRRPGVLSRKFTRQFAAKSGVMRRYSASPYPRVRYRPRALPDARFHPLLCLRNLRDSTLAQRWRRHRNPIDRIGKKQDMPFGCCELDDKRFVPAAGAQGHDGIGRDRLGGIGAHRDSKRSRQRARGQYVIAGQRAPVVAAVRATAPETIVAAHGRYAQRLVVPLREQRRVLDRRAKTAALVLELSARIG